ncbi:putative secreted protein [Granulibacter bethesdensis]|uniref:Secreted protein n=1 Tax=Granulibacter bethesdensis TaxID=364410 RepID=A0AAN0VGK3_9PROT|nr:putative secreted protein [Granulibacter bethesdensis]APH60462.1 putative secreted protein [Granulibacter bethesdensis]
MRRRDEKNVGKGSYAAFCLATGGTSLYLCAATQQVWWVASSFLLLKRRRGWPSALPPRGSIGCAQPRIMHGHP